MFEIGDKVYRFRTNKDGEHTFKEGEIRSVHGSLQPCPEYKVEWKKGNGVNATISWETDRLFTDLRDASRAHIWEMLNQHQRQINEFVIYSDNVKMRIESENLVKVVEKEG